MFDRKPSVAENKLLLLYTIHQLEPCTNLQLWQFVAENNVMDYLTFQLSLGELTEADQLLLTPHPIGSLYELTQEGADHLRLFEKKLPFSRKNPILSKTAQWKSRFQKEQFFLSDYSKNDIGGYTLVLSLFENKEILFQTALGLPDQQTCSYYAGGWPNTSSRIYAYFMETMGEGFSIEEDSPLPSVVSKDTRITPIEGGCIFEGDVKKGSPSFIHINAFLPSEKMAAFFVKSWQRKKDAFTLFLHQTLAK